MHPDTTPPKPSRLSQAMLWTASAALVLMMLIVVGDVVLRAAFNIPLRGAYDLVSILLLVMVAFGIGPVIVRRAEIVIDLLDTAVGPRVVRGLSILSMVLSLGVFLFFGWAAINPARDAWRYGDRSLELGVPQWALWGLALVGMVGILVSILEQARGYWRQGGAQ